MTVHPLYGKHIWDCNYHNFENGNPRIDKIIILGCNGLCNWKNFNILAQTTKGEYLPIENINDNYMYKCENITILEAISMSASNTVNEIISGVVDSNLGSNIMKFFMRLFCIILIIIGIFKMYDYYFKYNNNIIKK